MRPQIRQIMSQNAETIVELISLAHIFVFELFPGSNNPGTLSNCLACLYGESGAALLWSIISNCYLRTRLSSKIIRVDGAKTMNLHFNNASCGGISLLGHSAAVTSLNVLCALCDSSHSVIKFRAKSMLFRYKTNIRFLSPHSFDMRMNFMLATFAPQSHTNQRSNFNKMNNNEKQKMKCNKMDGK